MVVISTNSSSRYGIACIECNARPIAPNRSEYVSECQVRHFWSCENCGHQFETSDRLRFDTTSNARGKTRSLPLLVA